MPRFLRRIGRLYSKEASAQEPDPQTQRMIADPSAPGCDTCRFMLSMTHRCLNRNSPYYRRPVGVDDAMTCRFHLSGDRDRRTQQFVDQFAESLVAQTPAFPAGETPVDHLRSMRAMDALLTPGAVQGGHNGCFSCAYNTRRSEGVGYQGCHYPGSQMDLDPLDDGLRCPEWTRAPDAEPR
jgi:hypothetical protein